MDTEAITVILTVVLAVFAIIWHQQRSTEKLRDDVNANGQRLARIEGFLRIGMPSEAVATEPQPAEPAATPPAARPEAAVKPASGP